MQARLREFAGGNLGADARSEGGGGGGGSSSPAGQSVESEDGISIVGKRVRFFDSRELRGEVPRVDGAVVLMVVFHRAGVLLLG